MGKDNFKKVFMKKVILEKKQNIPYSLHDMIIKKFTLKLKKGEVLENAVEFIFNEGFVEKKSPYCQTEKGIIRIENIDLTFSGILVLYSDKNNQVRGKKIRLQDFEKEFSEYEIEIIDELYGYNRVQYNGYLYVPDSNALADIEISIYYFGDLIYITE